MLGRLIKDKSGHFAVMTALVAMPVLIAVGVGVDSKIITRQVNDMQSALDSAALAAAVKGNMDDAEKEAFAKEVFTRNYHQPNEVRLSAKAQNNYVTIEGTLDSDEMLIPMITEKVIKFSRKARAVKTEEDVICLLALHESQQGALIIEENARVAATDCSFQVNSTHSNALWFKGNYEPVAQQICSAGGVRGNFSNPPNTHCEKVEDPNAAKRRPTDLTCDYGPFNALFPATAEELVYVNESSKTLNPGVFCGGLHVYNSNITLNPGTYVIQDGPLTVGAGSSISGDGVTFVFSGQNSVLYTYRDVSMDLKAPKTGPYAGFVFFQDRFSSAGDTSILKGSVDVKLVGTSYFPTQKLFLGGDGEMGASSPSMSFIANELEITSDISKALKEFKGNLAMTELLITTYATLNPLSLDLPKILGDLADPVKKKTQGSNQFNVIIQTSDTSHTGEGMPQVLPLLSDEGARLVSAHEPIEP